MEIIYQSIFFLAIGFIAIAIAVFVLAVSLLGRAVKISVDEQIGAEGKLKEETEKEIERIQEQLKVAISAKKIGVKELVKSLKEFKNKDSKHKRTLWWIRFKPKLLTAKWGAIVPSVLFLFSAVCNGFALYYYKDLPNNANTFAAISVAPLVIGVLIIAATLKAIESVAITSDEIIAIREKETFKTALIEIEETKRPKLCVRFKDKDFPLRLDTQTKVNIKAFLTLENGDFGENIQIFFYFPPNFKVLGSTKVLDNNYKYPDYIGVEWEMEKIKRGLEYKHEISFETPPAAGNYILLVYSFCKGGWTDNPEVYEIIVEEYTIPF